MRRRSLALILALSACSSPDPTLFTLQPRPGAVRPAPVSAVELRRIGLARYLDRPAVVHSAADYELQLGANERWAEPLGDMLGRIVVDDLAQRLPGTHVFSDAGAITSPADAIVLEIDLRRLDIDAGGAIVLRAEVALVRDGASSPTSMYHVNLTVPVTSTQTRDVVAAMSTAVGQLADTIATALATQPVVPIALPHR